MPPQPDLSHAGLTELRRIGDGGFGAVYAARQDAFEREVAVKVLDAKITDASVRARFERECRALGKLSAHPNIVTVFDSGFANDRPYLVMEFVTGGSLADKVAASGRLREQQATAAGVALAGALETAHRAGVLHRDVKPENVLLSEYGAPLLADFGIARLEGGPSTTTTGKVTTSVAHAAPEIFDAADPAANWDTYALGSTLFTVLAGRYAFVEDGMELLAILRRIIDQPVPDLRERGVPDGLAKVVERAMAKKPGDRYASALGMGRALQQVQRDQSWTVTPLLVPGEPQEGEAPDPAEETVLSTIFLPSEQLKTPAPIPDWDAERPSPSARITPGPPAAHAPRQTPPPQQRQTPPPRQRQTPPPQRQQTPHPQQRQAPPPQRQQAPPGQGPPPQWPSTPQVYGPGPGTAPGYGPAGQQGFAPRPTGPAGPPPQWGPGGPQPPPKRSSGCLTAFLVVVAVLVGLAVIGVLADTLAA